MATATGSDRVDTILEGFLTRQYEDAVALAAQSDLLDVVALDWPPQRYLVRFSCRGLVQGSDGSIALADDFHLGIYLPDDFLRAIDPMRIVTWLAPQNVFHPQVRPPFICLGRLVVGTSLVEILFQAWEVITCRKVTMREDDALNHAACAWARRNLDRFPVDPRPLKRRPVDFKVELVEVPG
jgi:hypothetical protein